MSQSRYYFTFDDEFFTKHQSKLLFALNTPIIKSFSRYILRINGNRSSVGNRKIFKINKNAIRWKNDGENVVEVRTHNKFSKRLYHSFKPIWWAMHYWDEIFADRLVPSLSFGFGTLTVYPNSGSGGTRAVDGLVGHQVAGNAGISWAALRNGAGTFAITASDTGYMFQILGATGANTWSALYRGIYMFHTEGLFGETVSSAVLSLYIYNKSDVISALPDSDIYTSTSAATNNLVASDYTALGTVSQSSNGPIAYNDIVVSAYSDFILNATGLSNLNPNGISRFGSRNANYDVANVAPTYAGFNGCQVAVGTSDAAGLQYDPKIVITYLDPPPSTPTLTSVSLGVKKNTIEWTYA